MMMMMMMMMGIKLQEKFKKMSRKRRCLSDGWSARAEARQKKQTNSVTGARKKKKQKTNGGRPPLAHDRHLMS